METIVDKQQVRLTVDDACDPAAVITELGCGITALVDCANQANGSDRTAIRALIKLLSTGVVDVAKRLRPKK